jgi:hypothetical protein
LIFFVKGKPQAAVRSEAKKPGEDLSEASLDRPKKKLRFCNAPPSLEWRGLPIGEMPLKV